MAQSKRMKTEPENQTIRMRSYLLGLLPESEQNALEEAFFADSEMLEHMQEVEFDLVDSYVRGKLSNDERGQFERHYLVSPQHLERVAVARELLRVANEQVSPLSVSSKESFWEKLLASLRAPQFAFGAAVTAVVLLLVGVNWLAIQKTLWHQQRQKERVAELNRRTELENQIALQNERNAKLNSELERLRNETAPRIQPTLFSFALLSTVRGGSEQQILKIPGGTDQVRLLMKTESGNYRSFLTNIRQVDGNGSWNQAANAAKQPNGGATVSVKIPANKLSSGDYILTLNGTDATGSTEEINRYFFRVATK